MNPYYRGYSPYLRGNNSNERGLLLPFLVGAAVAFPIGYIASNTNRPQSYYQMPYYQPYYQPTPAYYQQMYQVPRIPVMPYY